MDKKSIIITIVAAIVFAGAGFYGGMKYQASKSPFANFQRNGGGFATFGQGAGSGSGTGGANRIMRNSGGFVAGEIIKKDDKSITIQLGGNGGNANSGANGSSNATGSKTIYYSDTTTVSKSVDGTKDDMAVGKNVMITGTANSDGSIIAQLVQIRPENAATGSVEVQGNPAPTQDNPAK
ncbi:MAG: hypothetical protein WCW77_05340 [Patescibacteria group bacterium]|jgi:hypothetical protein